ncbi:MAG: pyridoxal phosphate-dependent aminotransferase [Deltaproteobacteria bacterium]|nr:MAG: pyridoxal phosphate-dependent aminotransferase [Deltaproteobacteria bacterium]
MKRQGIRVLSLAAGQPDFLTPQFIRKAACDAIEAGHTGYAPSAGIPELRKAIRGWASKWLGVDYADDQVVVGVGAKQCLANAMLALCGPGDRILLQAPYWVSYPEQAKICGAEAVILPAAERPGELNLRALEAELDRGAKVLVLNSPSNPCGTVVPQNQLEVLCDLVASSGLFVVCDDIYDRIVFDGRQVPHVLRMRPELAESILVVNGVSKAYSMTGWRLGWALGPADVIAAMRKLQDQTTSNAVTFVQHAAVAALEHGDDAVSRMVSAFERRRDMVCEMLSRIDGLRFARPEGAFYLLVNVRDLLGRRFGGEPVGDDVRLAELLLESRQVAVVPGSGFGAAGTIRLSFAASEDDLRQAVERVADFVGELE